jgi:hypothetical protein
MVFSRLLSPFSILIDSVGIMHSIRSPLAVIGNMRGFLSAQAALSILHPKGACLCFYTFYTTGKICHQPFDLSQLQCSRMPEDSNDAMFPYGKSEGVSLPF